MSVRARADRRQLVTTSAGLKGLTATPGPTNLWYVYAGGQYLGLLTYRERLRVWVCSGGRLRHAYSGTLDRVLAAMAETQAILL